MSEGTGRAALRQRVGRRLGLRPYYTIVERGAGRLRLDSLPEANRGPGAALMGLGAALILVATIIIGSGTIAASQSGSFNLAAASAVVGGLLGGLGVQRVVGGYAIYTTRNQIRAEGDALVFTQTNRVARPRSQRLALAQVAGLRLRRRPLMLGRLLRRVRPIVALELLVGPEVWVVDTAESGDDLQEVAAALDEIIGSAAPAVGTPP